jgi:hypothetical protein
MAQDKLILVRNAQAADVDERVASYADITAGGNGKACKVELVENTATGEFILLFPEDIPYYHFTLLLSALNMPWINNEGAKAAGWAEAKDGEGTYMHVIAKDESDVLVAVNDKNEGIIIVGGETSPISSTEKMPIEFFTPDTAGNLKPIASYGLILEDFDAEEEEEDDEELATPTPAPAPHVEAKKMSMVTVVIIIAVVSAGLIALLMLADK